MILNTTGAHQLTAVNIQAGTDGVLAQNLPSLKLKREAIPNSMYRYIIAQNVV